MAAGSVLDAIPGGADLVAWFGGETRFHDGLLLEIGLDSTGPSRLRIHAWVTTDAVDERGFLILDRHAVVTITLHEVTTSA